MMNMRRRTAVMAAAKTIFLFESVSRHIRAQLSVLKAHVGSFILLFPCNESAGHNGPFNFNL